MPPRRSWIGSVFCHSVRQRIRPRRRQLEVLESRAMMAGLVHEGDLGYLGAFNLPQGDIGSSTFAYGGSGLAYNPANHSLFMSGHDWKQELTEVSIPALRNGSLNKLNTAGLLQPFTPVLGRIPNQTLSKTDGIELGGLIVDGDRLIGSAYEFYDGNGDARDSHFTLSSTDLASADVGGMYRVGDRGGGYVGGYMAKVPAEWQEALGTSYITGQAGLSIISRTSVGPAAFGFNPNQLGDSAAPATPLVYYPLAHRLAPESTQNPWFNTTTEIKGVVIPEGTDSMLFIGSHGTGPWWDGEADQDGNYDEHRPSKGPHAPDYVYQVWAYNLHDLAAVKNGEMQPWEVQPYDVWDFDLPYFEGSKHIGGVAYDSASGQLFVSQQFGQGDYPVIHAVQVGTGSGEVTPPPPPPSTDGNEAPWGVSLTNTRQWIAENTPVPGRLKIGDISLGDDGKGENRFQVSGPDRNNFEIVGRSLYLKAGTKLNFEAKSYYWVTVQAGDSSVNHQVVEVYHTLKLGNVNAAPVLNANVPSRQTNVRENATKPAGQMVRNFASSTIVDADVGALQGIAITAASDYHGKWQYSTNDGVKWTSMKQPTDSAELLLPGYAKVRFIPNTSFHGTVRLWYRAWDQTSGNIGGTLPSAGNQGGSKSLSTAWKSAALTVSPTNDYPSLTLGGTIGYSLNGNRTVLASAAIVTNADRTNLVGGELNVQIWNGADESNRLGIAGPFVVSGTQITHNGVQIGTLQSNGSGHNRLTVMFYGSATQSSVQRLVRAITFRTVDATSTMDRIMSFVVTDGDGRKSSMLYKKVKSTT